MDGLDAKLEVNICNTWAEGFGIARKNIFAWVVFAAKYKGSTCTKGVSYYGHGVTGGVVSVLGAESRAAHENNGFT